MAHGRPALHGPNGPAMSLLATNEVLERMTAMTAFATAPAIDAAPAIDSVDVDSAVAVAAAIAIVPATASAPVIAFVPAAAIAGTSAVAIAVGRATAVSSTSADATEVAGAASQDVRPFRKGDLVVYPAHGIGTVDHVRIEEVGGHKLNWIKISFAENRMSLRIPVRKAKDIGLRRPVTRQAFAEVLTIIRGRPHTSRLVWTKRALEYQGKINSGCVKALAEVVRDLRPSLDGSESSFSRRSLFEAAIDRLATEFAAVFRTDKAAALGRLMAVPPVA
jgi:CarD family transcriptional regulator